MKMIYFLSAVLLLVMGRMLLFSIAEYEGRIPALPEQVKSITQFNDLALFELADGSSNVYRFRENSSRTEAHLRFALPGFDPSPYQLRLKLKARPELLKAARVRTARDVRHGGDVKGDIATFDISMKDPTPFVWSDGKCYVGVTFPKTSLKPGDTVELVDFRFELFK